MADSKDSKGDSYDLIYEVAGFIVLIFILGTVFARFGFDLDDDSNVDLVSEQNTASENSSVENNKNGSGGFNLANSFPVGDISLGNRVINKKEVDVYNVPAGSILGQQPKREVGKVVEGPEDKNSLRWWRMDYENAPDGWVKESSLSEYVWGYRLLNIFPIIFGAVTPFLILLSVIFFILIIIILVKMSSLEKLKEKKLNHARGRGVSEEIGQAVIDEQKEDENDIGLPVSNLPIGNEAPKTKDVHNKRWAKVETLINSHNVNDWKQAIIESDIILDEMLDKIGYKGDTVAEKLKQVEESDFLTLSQAWEAHKIRNRIAHKGSDYILSRNDAERATNLFKEVFKEFYFI